MSQTVQSSDVAEEQVAARLSTRPDMLRLYRQMIRIRLFEEQVNELYTSARMPGLAHLYVGQEAVAVGVCAVLGDEDYITSTHRGHGHCLAKGGSVDRMFAELLGKKAGYCRGKGGSMHIADQEKGNLGANAIVGGSTGIATGAALSARMRKTDQVAVCFFGEGALGQGLLYEVMNMASLWKLPVIYVCENNQYNEYTHYRETTAGEIQARPAAFGIPCTVVDGQNVREVVRAAAAAVDRARSGAGPSFLQCDTYRYYGHYVGDIDRSYYRSKSEEQLWVTQRDPLQLHGAWLKSQGMSSDAELSEIRRAAKEEILAGVEFALSAPYPEANEVDQHVYC